MKKREFRLIGGSLHARNPCFLDPVNGLVQRIDAAHGADAGAPDGAAETHHFFMAFARVADTPQNLKGGHMQPFFQRALGAKQGGRRQVRRACRAPEGRDAPAAPQAVPARHDGKPHGAHEAAGILFRLAPERLAEAAAADADGVLQKPVVLERITNRVGVRHSPARKTARRGRKAVPPFA